MEKTDSLPFKVGQLAESKSFIVGFRGAWFRCKIKGIKLKRGRVVHFLEFFDFPDEKVTSTQLYQKPPSSRVNSQEEGKMELMVRPCFPSFYRESEMPDLHTISEVVAITNNHWKVGDLVDWWFDGCFWSGRVTHLLGNDKVQIELLEPPLGEGRSYEAFCKDLRPSLDWSPEHGWTVPASLESETSCCARLIQPLNQVDKERKEHYSLRESNARGIGTALSEFLESSSSHRSVSSLPPQAGSSHPPVTDVLIETSVCGIDHEETCTTRKSGKLNLEDSVIRKASSIDDTSSSHEKVTSASDAMTQATSRKDRYNSSSSPKKMRIGEDEHVTSMMCTDSIESSVLGLEELAIKIRWIKGILRCGPRWSNPSWKFLEN
ncbi:uncharacterized protein LOC131221350 isoform X2 [Magnolia sinica]|uniref:uncharacterized protein LOC131221350 isoform X2 n=1 Tax=Magnolia sinica TaxID=86752 RepID=UPI00265A6065|nr:uncharacterized protein LOC131221350 isoform X2 [Magnolia sinica]